MRFGSLRASRYLESATSLLDRRGQTARLQFIALVDAASCALAMYLAAVLRYDFSVVTVSTWRVADFLLIAAGIHIASAWWQGAYQGRWEPGSFDGVLALTRASSCATPLVFVLNLLLGRPVPASVPIAGGLLALALTLATRAARRLAAEQGLRPTQSGHRLLVFGAGEGGAQLVRSLLRDPNSAYLPVALLDDDPAKAHRCIRSVSVVGTRADLARAVTEYAVDTVVVAIPSATAELIRAVAAEAEPLGVVVKVVPTVSNLFGSAVQASDIRPLSEADLLGRNGVDLQLAQQAGYLTGRRILVTGAGGSIGSELCRQLVPCNPAEVVMLDRDESALHAVQLSIEGRALLDAPQLVVADIRDGHRLNGIFAEFRPQVVFHAAALKHLTLLERHPYEAFRTNVLGTAKVLDASLRHGVEHFVNISTDKAADPQSVLGYSKRIAERLTAAAAQVTSRPYLSVRFGNVLGSRGSVLTTFRSQIESGGPLTVTDPRVSRYFMTIPEASRLVIEAGAVGSAGEVLVLDMGEPVLIASIAEKLISSSGKRIKIVYTGLRPGEKIDEARLASGETDARPIHPLISQATVRPLYPEALHAVRLGAEGDLTSVMRSLCQASSSRSAIWGDLPADPDAWSVLAPVHTGRPTTVTIPPASSETAFPRASELL